MKIKRLETHDRLQEFQKQSQDISQGITECIRNVPDSITCPFYVYGHSRTVEYDEKISILIGGAKQAPAARMIWMPVITKPEPAPNTYLFLCRKGSDTHQIIWILPKAEMWDQFAPGQMCHNEIAWDSIQSFLNNRQVLTQPDKDGPTAQDVQHFRRTYGHEAQKIKNMKKIKKIIATGIE